MASSDYFKLIKGLMLIAGVLLLGVEESCTQSYLAAVVAHSPIYSLKDLPDVREKKIATEYVSLITDLYQTDIVVFPEHGISTLVPNPLLKPNLDAYSIEVPEVETTAFKNKILSDISSVAKTKSVYVVINVLEKLNSAGMKYYSTDVVFDQDGKLVAKCRKRYLYKEINYDKGDSNQKCTFDARFKRTNLSVKFALLFDTDLLTPKDEMVHDAILTSSLPNMLPLSYGLSLQAGYSVRNKINLLASGYTQLTENHGGTGIYLGNGTSWVRLSSDLVLYREVPIRQQDSTQVVNVIPPGKPDKFDNIPYETLSTLSELTKDVKKPFKSDGGENYCTLHMDSSSNDIKPYKWVALTDRMSILGQEKHVILCALIKPEASRNEKNIVNGITIEVVSKADNIIQVLPLSLGTDSNSNLLPVNYRYTENLIDKKTNVTVKLANPGDVTIFGVLVILKTGVSYGTSIHVSHMCIVGFFSIFAFLWAKCTL